MKAPSPTMLAMGAIGLTVITLFAIGAPMNRKPPPPPPAHTGWVPTVSAGNFTLTSATIDLPSDEATYPDGPNADTINANCTSCHSASMAMTQPALSADQWNATVVKMREIYKAPVAEKDIQAIVAYLVAMPSQKTAPATGKAQDPDPKAAPDISGQTG